MKPRKRLLIVDDEPNIRRILEVAFEKEGIQTATAENGMMALKLLSEGTFDAVITDVTMPGMTGYKLQEEIHNLHPNMPVIICTAYGTIQEAVAAIRKGAFEFVTKPFDINNLKKIVKNAMDAESSSSRKTSGSKSKSKTPFIAESPAMREILETIEQVADSRATVLILGESGTGKEVVAKLIHELSDRSSNPFVACSCAALPESLLEAELFGHEKGAFTGATSSRVGRFEAAHTGTLFLDEIGEVPLAIQAKLLRVLQEREFERLGATKSTKVDVRLVTATNRNLQREVDAGNFRLDLLYRLQVIELNLPPLRDRHEDIEPLAEHFLKIYAKENGKEIRGFTPEALRALQAYAWPGNIRELGNVVERAVVLAARGAEEIDCATLPKSLLVA